MTKQHIGKSLVCTPDDRRLVDAVDVGDGGLAGQAIGDDGGGGGRFASADTEAEQWVEYPAQRTTFVHGRNRADKRQLVLRTPSRAADAVRAHEAREAAPVFVVRGNAGSKTAAIENIWGQLMVSVSIILQNALQKPIQTVLSSALGDLDD